MNNSPKTVLSMRSRHEVFLFGSASLIVPVFVLTDNYVLIEYLCYVDMLIGLSGRQCPTRAWKLPPKQAENRN